MSRGNDRGREHRSNEPQLATVRRLHLDDGDGSTTTATEEWYETERLTGQITGRARHAPPADPPAPAQNAAPVVLDWRHAPAVPSPTALQRLRRSVAGRGGDRLSRADTQDAEVPPSARACEVQQTVLATTSQVQPAPATEEDEPATDEIRAAPPSGPRIGLRGDAEPAPPRAKRWGTMRTYARERSQHLRLGRTVIVSVVVLSLAAVSVIGIASQTNSTATRPHRASLVAATSRPDVGVGTTTKSVIGALGVLEHQVRTSRARHRVVRAHRRPREKSRARRRRVSKQPSVSRPESSPPVTAPTTAPRTSSYSSSSSSPAYSSPASQPVTAQPAPAATRSAPQPAGPSGPGGTVGANCNPKCS
jgi:hypothetical protein